MQSIRIEISKRIIAIITAFLVMIATCGSLYGSVYAASNNSYDKEETIYAVMDADGDINEIIVDELLSNKYGEKIIEDESTLEGIVNTSGKETFKKDGNRLTWEANGKSIRYQGTSNEPLPVCQLLSE